MFTLPPLPYLYDALQPVVSSLTMRTHHDKHHKTYVDTLNTLIADREEEFDGLEAVIAHAAADPAGKLFHNAAQAWNHGFFWECMSPTPGEPSAAFTALRDQFIEEGAAHFASGWAWIAAKGEEMTVLSTHDADTLAHRTDLSPILVCDLWEHAYYLDYKNDRKGFLTKWFDEVANWRFAESQLNAARGRGAAWRYPRPTGERGSLGETAQTTPKTTPGPA